MLTVSLALLALIQDTNDAPPAARVHRVELEAAADRLALRDLDGDGRSDLVRIAGDGLRAALQDDDGGFSAFGAPFDWPGETLGWCLADLDGRGGVDLLVLGQDGIVRAHGCDATGFDAGRVVLEGTCYLPHGRSRMPFARDVDGDGRLDLVLPGSGRYLIHLQAEDGTFADPLEIEFDVQVTTQVGDPNALDARFGQSVRVPWFELEDVDGDGTDDLVARTSERVDFHLARPELAASPTWSLDLAALEAQLPSSRDVNFDDLLSNIELGVQYTLADVDGVAPRDLVVQLGATVKLYLGGSVTGVEGDPDQVLRISGNLLYVLVRDADGDGRADLQMLRGDRISLGRALRWLVLPGALDFDFFTYRNEGAAFSRKPTRRNTVQLKIPRLLTLADEVEEIEDEVERQQSVPARRLDLHGDGADDDVVDVEGGALVFFADCAPSEDEDLLRGLRDGNLEQALADIALDDVDQLEDGGTKVIDVGDLDTWTYSPGAALRAAREGRTPSLRVPLDLASEDDEEPDFRPLDLNGDGKDDVVAWQRRAEGGWSVRVVVRR